MEEKKEVTAQPKARFEIAYKSGGQEVKLNETIVRNYLTKGNTSVTDADILQFISLCKYNELNPFLGESFLVKYGTSPAQMIVSKEAYLKRADLNANYAGFKAGIIVRKEISRENGKVVFGNENREGCFMGPGEELVGGWAEVYRTDKKYPYYQAVSFTEYNKGQSLWKEKPSTMIRKVAIVQALREAFPTQLSALYIPEETNVRPEDAEAVEIPVDANGEILDMGNMQEEVPEETKAQPQAEAQQSNVKQEAKPKKEAAEPIGKQKAPDIFGGGN